jgi:hypothetical protein
MKNDAALREIVKRNFVYGSALAWCEASAER